MKPQQTLVQASSNAGVIQAGHRIAAFVVGAALMGLALRQPFGASEADTLAWLHGLLAPGSDLVAVVHRGFVAGAAVVNLALAGLLNGCGIPDRLALRGPDAAALFGLAAYVLARPGRSGRGPLFAALLVASPLYWAAPIVMTGLGMNTLGVFMFYRAATRGDRETPAMLVALAGLVLLVVNGATLAPIGLLAGFWLHRGLSAGDWRLFGNTRLTLLGLAGLAALTLTDRLVLPDIARLGSSIEMLGHGLGIAGPSTSWVMIAALVISIALPIALALAVTIRDGGGRIALILGLSLLVAASAPAHAAALIVLPSVLLLWGLADALVGGQRRWLAGVCAACLLALLCLRVTVWLGWAWPVLAVGAAALAIASAGLLSNRGAQSVAALALMLALGVAGALYDNTGLFEKRSERAALTEALPAPGAQPIAVLAPLSARYWAEVLGRPVFAADDIPALCAWALDKPKQPVPWLIGVPAALSAPIDIHLLQQSPGTVKTSVIVGELRGCAAGKPTTRR